MIYLDNAATTYPKPRGVRLAVQNAMMTYGANPGRGGYPMAMQTTEQIFLCRKKLAQMFHCASEEEVVFCLNCTQAINMVLKGCLKEGDHVVVSCLEHNAVMRPLEKLRRKGVFVTVAKVFPGDDDKTLESFERCMKGNTRLVICTHVSNVWGLKLPVQRIAELSHRKGAEFLTDGAQSGGVFPLDLQKDGIDYLCLAGHKGFYGPMGVGILLTSHGKELDTVLEGGTGSLSASLDQPDLMPDRLESGTPNTWGILGLSAGIDFVRTTTMEKIRAHEMKLTHRLYRGLQGRKDVRLYTGEPAAPVLSFPWRRNRRRRRQPAWQRRESAYVRDCIARPWHINFSVHWKTGRCG